MTEEQLVERFERENITLASISSRALAFFVDELIVSVLFLVAFWGSFKSDDPEETIMLINSLFIYIIS